MLSNPMGVTVADGKGQGTIVDDDAAAVAAMVGDVAQSDLQWALTVLSSDGYDFVARVDVHDGAGTLETWQLTLDLPVSISAIAGACLLYTSRCV